ncbi:MAG: methylated DNA-protein cysteine methyltransferase [Saprospiraceae bacterium]
MGKNIEKLHKHQEPEIKEGPEKWNEKFGGNKMLIATPLIIDKLVKTIPEGTLVDMEELRSMLAEDYKADYTCPLTTGIFLNIVARAAEEYREEGAKDISPYWRVIKNDRTLNEKFPGGMEGHAALLKKEGFTIVPKGKNKLMVKD